MRTGLAIVVIACLATSARAQCVDKFQGLLTPANGSPVTNDGPIGLAISGDRVFATNRELIGSDQNGIAQEYLRLPNGTWVAGQRILPPASLNNGQKPLFADRLALDGDRLCIGTSDLSQIWIHERIAGVWTEVKTFVGQGGNTEFGIALALQGDTLIVGEPQAKHPTLNTTQSGLVRIYSRASGTWQLAQTLIGSPLQGGRFGSAVALDGTTMLVSALGEPTPPTNETAIYAYDWNGSAWVQTSKFTASFGSPAGLGQSLDLSGSRAVVSSEGHGAFVFERSGPFWFQTQIVVPPLSSSAGTLIAIDGNRIAVNDLTFFKTYNGRGAIHLFEYESGTWVPRARIITPESIGGSGFGTTIALQGDLLLGHCKNPGNPPGSQKATILAFSAIPNSVPDYGVGCPGSGGAVPLFDDLVSYDGCFFANDVVSYRIANGLGGSVCIVLVAAGQAAIPLQGACSLLVAPPVTSVVVPLIGVGPGNGAITLSASIPLGLPASSVYMQGFALDAGTAIGYAATNGMRLTVQ